STDEARPILTGVFVKVEDNQIVMAAADGFRLSVRTAEIESTVEKAVTVVIPARALIELARIAGDGKDPIRMALMPQSGRVVFRTNDTELVSQLIEGQFPDYEQIIPRSYQTRTTLSTPAFLKACKQAEIFAREGSLIARLNITPGESEMVPGVVEIFGQSEETGSSQTVVDASIEGPPILIAFNVRYLREALDVIKTSNVALETTTDTSPGVLRPVGDNNFVHVIMPMHLG
ncbi:MAG TPA: DNA polymerase III subunit beta, partial [Anaerolineales bacterium]|nr:DNA polymerase III subunit beta [Anaerolineales bacterium]